MSNLSNLVLQGREWVGKGAGGGGATSWSGLFSGGWVQVRKVQKGCGVDGGCSYGVKTRVDQWNHIGIPYLLWTGPGL